MVLYVTSRSLQLCFGGLEDEKRKIPFSPVPVGNLEKPVIALHTLII